MQVISNCSQYRGWPTGYYSRVQVVILAMNELAKGIVWHSIQAGQTQKLLSPLAQGLVITSEIILFKYSKDFSRNDISRSLSLLHCSNIEQIKSFMFYIVSETPINITCYVIFLTNFKKYLK